MRSRETALGATIRFFERYAGIDRAGKTHRPSGPGLPDGGVGVLPDAVPDRLLGAWIADDVCACEAFFIEGKTKSEPCGLPERIRGVSPPPVDVFGFERYPETVRRLKACVEGAATDARG